jgi:hypothetical protein
MDVVAYAGHALSKNVVQGSFRPLRLMIISGGCSPSAEFQTESEGSGNEYLRTVVLDNADDVQVVCGSVDMIRYIRVIALRRLRCCQSSKPLDIFSTFQHYLHQLQYP